MQEINVLVRIIVLRNNLSCERTNTLTVHGLIIIHRLLDTHAVDLKVDCKY